MYRVVYVIINKRPLESFHAFGSDFITLAVILVSDSFVFYVGSRVGRGVREAGWKHEASHVRGCYNITFICTPIIQEALSVGKDTSKQNI